MGYKPVSHDPTVEGQRGKRFFRHDTVEEMQSLAKQLTQANKTDRFVSVVTQMEGELAYMSENEARPKFFEWRRHVLFWVRATQCSGKQTPQDEIAAADAKAALEKDAKANALATFLLTWKGTCVEETTVILP